MTIPEGVLEAGHHTTAHVGTGGSGDLTPTAATDNTPVQTGESLQSSHSLHHLASSLTSSHHRQASLSSDLQQVEDRVDGEPGQWAGHEVGVVLLGSHPHHSTQSQFEACKIIRQW